MPTRYGSCHTAGIGGHAIEGHVPAREIRRLLEKAMLAKLQPGDKVKFKVINDAGKFTVTEIQPAR